MLPAFTNCSAQHLFLLHEFEPVLKELLNSHLMSFSNCQVLVGKVRLWTCRRVFLSVYYFVIDSNWSLVLIYREPGREPAEVSGQGDDSPMFLFITKHGQKTTWLLCLPELRRKSIKRRKSHLSNACQTWLFSCLCCIPPTGPVERNTVYLDHLLDIKRFSLTSSLFNPV